MQSDKIRPRPCTQVYPKVDTNPEYGIIAESVYTFFMIYKLFQQVG